MARTILLAFFSLAATTCWTGDRLESKILHSDVETVDDSFYLELPAQTIGGGRAFYGAVVRCQRGEIDATLGEKTVRKATDFELTASASEPQALRLEAERPKGYGRYIGKYDLPWTPPACFVKVTLTWPVSETRTAPNLSRPKSDVVRRPLRVSAASSSLPVVKVEDLAAAVEASELPLVVHLSPDWCQPCKESNPKIDFFAGKYSGRLKFIRVPGPDFGTRADSFPSLLLYRGGKLESRIEGWDGQVSARLESALGALATATAPSPSAKVQAPLTEPPKAIPPKAPEPPLPPLTLRRARPKTFESEIAASPEPALLVLNDAGCADCARYASTVLSTGQPYSGRMKAFLYDLEGATAEERSFIEGRPEIGAKAPLVVLFSKGKVVWRREGPAAGLDAELAAALRKHLGK